MTTGDYPEDQGDRRSTRNQAKEERHYLFDLRFWRPFLNKVPPHDVELVDTNIGSSKFKVLVSECHGLGTTIGMRFGSAGNAALYRPSSLVHSLLALAGWG
jgi:hypothetical protein